MNAPQRLARGLKIALSDQSVKGTLIFALGMVFWAAAVYHFVEGWTWLDSIYFSVVTISTVGYGDFSPETVAGKIFTVFYVVIGLGIFVTAVTTVAKSIISHTDDQEDK